MDKEELKAFFQLKNFNEDVSLLDEMVKEVDENDDGKISIKEFGSIMNIYSRKLVEN